MTYLPGNVHPNCADSYYRFIENCLRNGVNGWGATSTERWFVERLEEENKFLQEDGAHLTFEQVLVNEYRRGLPQLAGKDWEAYQEASRTDKLDEWAHKRAREPAP